MTFDDVTKRRDKSVLITLVFKKIIGDDAGIWNIEYFENKPNNEFKEYAISEMKKLGFNSMIFTGWIFTKALYEKFKNYIKSEQINKDPELFYLFFFELNTFIIFNSKEGMLNCIKNMDQSAKEDSNLNLKEIIECDNGIEVHFFTKTKSYLFEEKPEPFKLDYEKNK